jgi:hypothetical protein
VRLTLTAADGRTVEVCLDGDDLDRAADTAVRLMHAMPASPRALPFGYSLDATTERADDPLDDDTLTTPTAEEPTR